MRLYFIYPVIVFSLISFHLLADRSTSSVLEEDRCFLLFRRAHQEEEVYQKGQIPETREQLRAIEAASSDEIRAVPLEQGAVVLDTNVFYVNVRAAEPNEKKLVRKVKALLRQDGHLNADSSFHHIWIPDTVLYERARCYRHARMSQFLHVFTLPQGMNRLMVTADRAGHTYQKALRFLRDIGVGGVGEIGDPDRYILLDIAFAKSKNSRVVPIFITADIRTIVTPLRNYFQPRYRGSVERAFEVNISGRIIRIQPILH